MRERFIIFLIGLLGFNSLVKAQQAYFIDGYHGGVYGHYPMGQTSFIVQKLKQYPGLESQSRDRTGILGSSQTTRSRGVFCF